MAKMNGWTKLLVGTAVTLVAVGIAWGTLFNKVETMDEDGCEPAQDHIPKIASVETNIANINDTMTDMKEDHKVFQQAMFKALGVPKEPDEP